MLNAEVSGGLRWRWESFDFDRSQVHVSCPVCYDLTRAPIDDLTGLIKCAHANCTFAGTVQVDSNAEDQYQEWKKRSGSAAAGLVDKLTWSPFGIRL